MTQRLVTASHGLCCASAWLFVQASWAIKGSKAPLCAIGFSRTLTTIGMVPGGGAESMLARTSRIAVARRRESLVSKGRCEACWLHNSMCLCEALRRLWAGHQPLKTHVAVYYHYKEWGRSSNTGRLLSIGLGEENVTTYIYGQDEAALNELLTTKPSCILFPSASSVPIDDLFKNSLWGAPPGVERGDGAVGSEDRVLCVLDSTWNQASALDKSLSSSIPRVNINAMVDGPSNFLSRKQSITPNKISTIEAAALALQLLGEEKDALDRIELSLKMSVDVLKVQGGREPVFSSQVGVVRPSFAPTHSPTNSHAQAQAQWQGQTQGPFTAPSIVKPEVCPLCKVAPRRGFKNLGLRRPFDEENQRAGSFAYRVWRCTSCSECFNVEAALPPSDKDIDIKEGEGEGEARS